MAKRALPLIKSVEIRERLRALREKNKFTQGELGEKLGVSGQAVSSWEAGANEPPIQLFIELTKIYHVSLNYLLCIDDETTPPWLQTLTPLRLLLDQLDGAGAATLAKAVEICLEMKGLKKEEPPSNPKETNPIARRGRRAAGGV